MQDLVLICAGEFGEEMVDNLRLINEVEPRWNLLGFIDDRKIGEVAGVPILGTVEDFLKMDKHIQYFVATLDGKVREKIMARCKAAGFTGATIIGVNKNLNGVAALGEGVYVGHKYLLEDGAVLEDGVILEHGCSVCGNAVVGAFTTCRIYMNVGNGAKIGKYNHFAMRCLVDDNVTTADGCSFAAGSVVLTDTPETAHYEGIPAKRVDQ